MPETKRTPVVAAPPLESGLADLLARLSSSERVLVVSAEPRGEIQTHGRIPQIAAERVRRIAASALGESDAAILGVPGRPERGGLLGWVQGAKAKGRWRPACARRGRRVRPILGGARRAGRVGDRAGAGGEHGRGGARPRAGADVVGAARPPVRTRARDPRRARDPARRRSGARGGRGAPHLRNVGIGLRAILDRRARPRFRRLIERSNTNHRVSEVFPLERGDGTVAPVYLTSRARRSTGARHFCVISAICRSTKRRARSWGGSPPRSSPSPAPRSAPTASSTRRRRS